MPYSKHPYSFILGYHFMKLFQYQKLRFVIMEKKFLIHFLMSNNNHVILQIQAIKKPLFSKKKILHY
jgi:hypothetical protein